MPIKNLSKLVFKILTAVIIAVVLFFPSNKVGASTTALTIVAGQKTYKFSECEIGNYNGKLYLKNAKEIVDGIYLDTVVRPKNAELIFSAVNDKPFTIISEQSGKGIDRLKLLEDIYTALNEKQAKVTANFKVFNAKITASELKKQTILRSEFSTSYEYSTSDRKHNIALATQKISGYVLKPNEEFSFNQTVGLRTIENGFKEAKVILNGEYVDGVGGGVCQVSTTLYNSALLAGMKITEQNSHSLLVSYIEPSFDAMVNSYTSDLRFVNLSDKPVYIFGNADGAKVTFKFYGVEQKERYERVSVVTESILPEEPLIIPDKTLSKGQTVIKTNQKEGAKSEGYVITYLEGVRIKTQRIRTDVYNALRGQVLTYVEG